MQRELDPTDDLTAHILKYSTVIITDAPWKKELGTKENWLNILIKITITFKNNNSVFALQSH